MARIVIHEDRHSAKITVGNELKSFCMCGLSKNAPFCDGAHKITQTEEPGKVYQYDESGNRKEVRLQ